MDLVDPFVANHPSRTKTLSAPREAVIPAGAPMISTLGCYVGHVHLHSELAMRCRVCRLRFEGTSSEVHEQLRAHHDVAHPRPAFTAPPPAPPPAPVRVRAEKPRRGRPLTGTRLDRRALLTPCTGVITGDGARRGQPCGKPSTDGRCGRHPVSGVITPSGSCTPCPVLLTQGARRGQACGRAAPRQLCSNHEGMS
jgi:hypothetical protein